MSITSRVSAAASSFREALGISSPSHSFSRQSQDSRPSTAKTAETPYNFVNTDIKLMLEEALLELKIIQLKQLWVANSFRAMLDLALEAQQASIRLDSHEYSAKFCLYIAVAYYGLEDFANADANLAQADLTKGKYKDGDWVDKIRREVVLLKVRKRTAQMRLNAERVANGGQIESVASGSGQGRIDVKMQPAQIHSPLRVQGAGRTNNSTKQVHHDGTSSQHAPTASSRYSWTQNANGNSSVMSADHMNTSPTFQAGANIPSRPSAEYPHTGLSKTDTIASRYPAIPGRTWNQGYITGSPEEPVVRMSFARRFSDSSTHPRTGSSGADSFVFNFQPLGEELQFDSEDEGEANA